jgi:hypothetical protein
MEYGIMTGSLCDGGYRVMLNGRPFQCRVTHCYSIQRPNSILLTRTANAKFNTVTKFHEHDRNNFSQDIGCCKRLIWPTCVAHNSRDNCLI